MLVDFLFELRKEGLKVASHEWLALAEAMELGLHDSSSTASIAWRARCASRTSPTTTPSTARSPGYFQGVTEAALALTKDLEAWLADPGALRELTDEQIATLRRLGLDELRALYEQRLREQKERHDGGNRWIGTGGDLAVWQSRQEPDRPAGRPGRRALGDGGGRRAALRRLPARRRPRRPPDRRRAARPAPARPRGRRG
jgi:uncharacterized protein with von Willebrand factor type A (vWA) domain